MHHSSSTSAIVPNRKPIDRNFAETRRLEELARLLPLWPHELQDRSVEGRQRLRALIRRALRSERQRGIAGHWSYDLARHAALLSIYRSECAAEPRLGLRKPAMPSQIGGKKQRTRSPLAAYPFPTATCNHHILDDSGAASS